MSSIYRTSPLTGDISSAAIAGATTTDATTGTTTGLTWSVRTGVMYRLEAHLSMTTAAGTTAPQFALLRGSGCTLTSASMSVEVATGGAAIETTNVTSTTDGFTPGTTGMGATERPVVISAILLPATAGSITLQMRSDTAASAVTIVRGAGTLTPAS